MSTKRMAKFTNVKHEPAKTYGFKRSKVFDIPLYRSRFRLVITNNVGEYMKCIHRNDGFGHAEGCCVCYGRTSEVVLGVETGSTLSHEAVVHEICHLGQCILQHVGVEPDWKNQEPLAYLTGYVGGIILRTLNRWHVPLK